MVRADGTAVRARTGYDAGSDLDAAVGVRVEQADAEPEVVMVRAGTVIGPNVEIGENCKIAPNVYIGDGVVVGDNCRIGISASIRCSIVGSNVTLFAGVRLGEQGFGFAASPAPFPLHR